MDAKALIADELHRPTRKNYPRRKVTLKGLNDLYQADLVEMQPYFKTNKGYKYIMTMINCLSKFAFAVPLKNKSGEEVARALEPILAKHQMKNFHTDQGTEWFNKHVNKLMKLYNINHYYTFSDLKASIVERFNRTLKTKMYKSFTARGSNEWVSILQSIVDSYNNTKHSTIGMKPKDVRKKHVKEILKRIHNTNKKNIRNRPKFQVGDSVRISKAKRVFKKGYLPNWTNEIFKIHAVKPTKPITYILRDHKGEILKGGFYTEEISKSQVGNVHLVEKILKRKGNKLLIRWVGYDKDSDSWIDAKDLR